MDLPADLDVPEFRCFAASQEAVYPSVRKSRWHNYELLRAAAVSDPASCAGMRDLIAASLDDQPLLPKVRVHVSGDFFSQHYLQAWLQAAAMRPQQIFYCYTKSLSYWYQLKDQVPSNFYLTASYGGGLDEMIAQHPRTFYRYAKVVYTTNEAMAMGLPIDHDDSHCLSDRPFALLVHGTQRKGSEAGAAIRARRKEGLFSGYKA